MVDFSFYFGCHEQCLVRWLCSCCYIKELDYLSSFFYHILLLKYRTYTDWFLKRDWFFPMIFLEYWLHASPDNNMVHTKLQHSVSLALLLLSLFVYRGFYFHIEICHYTITMVVVSSKRRKWWSISWQIKIN